MPTNDGLPPINAGEHAPPTGDFVNHPNPGKESAKLGYETTDVNAGGIVVFIGGLFGFVLIFFLACFLIGKAINSGLNKQDGPSNKWNEQGQIFGGAKNNAKQHRDDLVSNTAMEQQELGRVTSAFPGPQLQTDDGNQATADLHAREDLLLDHYSSVPGQPIRIPIDQAMAIIAQRGLPVTQASAEQKLAYDGGHELKEPLTSGFARTGYELDTIEAREQKMMYSEAKTKEHAELRPLK